MYPEGYRAWVFEDLQETLPKRLGVDCNPINLRDGRVFVVAEGKQEAVELLINELRKGPTFAHVEDVDVLSKKPQETCTTFQSDPDFSLF